MGIVYISSYKALSTLIVYEVACCLVLTLAASGLYAQTYC